MSTVHSLGLELVGPSCRPHNVLSVGDDDINTVVSVIGSDVAVAELGVLRLNSNLVGTASGSLMGRDYRLQLAVGGGITGRCSGGHFGYEQRRQIDDEGGRLECMQREGERGLGVGQSDTQTMEVEAESVFRWKREAHNWRSSLSAPDVGC